MTPPPTVMPYVMALHIDEDHPAFAGHFPGMPIVPGVVLLDEALVAIERATGESLARCTLTSIKFQQVLRPGEALVLRFGRLPPCGFRFEIESDGRVIAAGRLNGGTPDAL
jgi:3-hydroxymyristoyl/3-hydroxydecanoyl-(acyl carrier protein) dehydratase